MPRSPFVPLVALSAVLLASPPARAQQRPTEQPVAIDIAASELVERYAAARGLPVSYLDPQVRQVQVQARAAGKELAPPLLRELLMAHDVVLVELPPGLLAAYHQRNLAIEAPVGGRVLLGQLAAAESDEMVSAVVPIRHGAGNAIFATVRGLMTRDANRLGNILYAQGPEVIVVVDLARQVRYYQELIAALDVPPVTPRWDELMVLELPTARLQALGASAKNEAELLRALEEALGRGEALLLERAGLGGSPGPFEVAREGVLVGEGELQGIRIALAPEQHVWTLRVQLTLAGAAGQGARAASVAVAPAERGAARTVLLTLAGRGAGEAARTVVVALRGR